MKTEELTAAAAEMLLQGRTIFPMKDINGNVCGCVGRCMSLSPRNKLIGTQGFVGKLDTREDTLIFVEGALAPMQAEAGGYDNVIGVFTIDVFTEDVLNKIKSLDKRVILFFDQDEAGRTEARELLSKMQAYEINAHMIETERAIDAQELFLRGYTVKHILNMIND